MNAPKINNPVGIEERKPVKHVEETLTAAPSLAVTPEEQDTAAPSLAVTPEEQDTATLPEKEVNMDETPFTSEEQVPSFWNIEARGKDIVATHRNGRVFCGTPKQFSGMLKA